MSVVTLTLLAPATLEEQILDLLLADASIARAGFTSQHVRGHGEAVTYQTVVEQVRGFTRLIEIVVTAPESDIQNVLVGLKDVLPDRGIAYRMTPVLSADVLR